MTNMEAATVLVAIYSGYSKHYNETEEAREAMARAIMALGQFRYIQYEEED